MYQYCKLINGLDLRHEPFYSTDCLTELSFPSSLPCPSLQPPLSQCVTRVLLPWAPNHSACSLDCVAPSPLQPSPAFPPAHWSGHHVRPLGASCLDSLEDVHHPLHFDPLNLSHGGDEHSSAGHAVTEGEGGQEGEEGDSKV